MKFEDLNRPRSKTSSGRDIDSARLEGRRQARIEFLAKNRWPYQSGVLSYGLTDTEIESILDKTSAYAERGIVDVRFGSDEHKRTVQRFGWPCLKNGWSIVPQGRGFTDVPGDLSAPDDERVPLPTPYISQHGANLKVPFYPTKWRNVRHTLRQFLDFENYTGANLAIQCCEASMHIRGIDGDCRDPEVAAFVKWAAFKHLGVTPFSRVGQAPKEMLLYRVEGDDIDIAKFTLTFLKPDGTPDLDEDGKPLNQVEYIANGGIITYYGLHHKTGESFDHSGGTLHPAMAGPEHAPIITRDQLRAFENELAAFRPLRGTTSNSNPFGGRSQTTEFVKDGRVWMPKVSIGDWQLDPEGYVLEGAESWLTAQVWAALGANANDLESLLPAVQAQLIAVAVEKLSKHRRSKRSYASPAAIETTVKSKLKQALHKWRQSLDSKMRHGEYLHNAVPYRILEDGRRPVVQRIVPSARPADGSLDWIPSETSSIEALAAYKSRTPVSMKPKTAEQIQIDRKCRALIEEYAERERQTMAISVQVDAAIGEVLDRICDVPLHILRAPTGAGKTTKVIDRFSRWCRLNRRQEDEGPVLIVVPSHANGEEALGKALAMDEYHGDLWSTSDVQDAIRRGEKIGVRIMRFMGREASGCQMIDQMKALSKEGIRGSGLCESRIDAVPELEAEMLRRRGEKVPKETVLCEFRARGECAYYLQHDKLRTADVVIVTHEYLTQNGLPKEMKAPRLVVVDENTTYQLLQQLRIPVSVLDIDRNRPKPSKADRARYPLAKSEEVSLRIYEGRLVACRLAKEALLSGKDVAGHFFRKYAAEAMTLVDEAIIVCERSHEADRLVLPNQTIDEVKKIAATATAEHLMEEIRFWRTVKDRLQMLIADAADKTKTAKGPRDMRIQVLQMPNAKTGIVEPHIRISWRRTPNWADRPMLLLDASANERIVAKCFGRQPTVTNIYAPLHVRTVAMIEKTWSTASFITRPDASSDEIATAAANISGARSLITVTALQYGHGRVLVGSTMAVREVIAGGAWTPPPNVDFVHFGALRGLDFAKHHVAAISIGRSEQPISVVDGYVAALTYDDDVPELPYDILGTGLTENGKPLFRPAAERVMTMRSGQDWSHWVPEMPGAVDADGNAVRSWAQDLEESWREEELRQFVGRLRPVYRGIMLDANGEQVEPPVWIAVGKVQPAGLVIDEIVEMAQLIKPAPFFELARVGGGGILDYTVLGNGEDVQKARESLPKVKTFAARTMSAMWLVKYRRGVNEKIAMVSPAWVGDGDAGEYWLAAAAAAGVTDAVILNVMPPSRKVTGRGEKRPDKADLRRLPTSEAIAAELTIKAIGQRIGTPAVEVEVRLANGERVGGIKLVEEVVEYDPDIEEDRLKHMPKVSHDDYWETDFEVRDVRPLVEVLAELRRR